MSQRQRDISFTSYAGWIESQPVLRDALRQVLDDDALPAAAGPHRDVIIELAAAREGVGGPHP